PPVHVPTVNVKNVRRVGGNRAGIRIRKDRCARRTVFAFTPGLRHGFAIRWIADSPAFVYLLYILDLNICARLADHGAADAHSQNQFATPATSGAENVLLGWQGCERRRVKGERRV